ncbi:MAG: hypothetical protein JNK82_35505 [Myxococcaceae bacterium]|nr:hypothetical protein [Myxococcaceae bacterium]
MKKLAALVGVYLLAWGALAFLWFDGSNAAAERGRRVVALGEQHAAQLPQPEGLPELAQACDAGLEPGDPHVIASYVAKAVEKPADENRYDEVVVAVDGTPLLELAREGSFAPVELEQAVLRTANPLEWTRLLPLARAGAPELESTRYLVVAKYFSLTAPMNEGTDGYTRGSGTYSARVVKLADGAVLCEGRGDVRMKETIDAAGRGDTKEAAQLAALENAAKLVPYVFSMSVTASPLAALCNVGGETLCRATGRWVGR